MLKSDSILWNRFVEYVTRSHESSNKDKQEEFIKEIDSLIKFYMDAMFEGSGLD